jgi:hypothetical protein
MFAGLYDVAEIGVLESSEKPEPGEKDPGQLVPELDWSVWECS